MQYDESPLAYWKRREAEERVLCHNPQSSNCSVHEDMANRYAALIAEDAGGSVKLRVIG